MTSILNKPKHEYSELKDCPFCGGKAALNITKQGTFIACTQCFARSNIFPHYGKEDLLNDPDMDTAVDFVIDWWNKRKNNNEREE